MYGWRHVPPRWYRDRHTRYARDAQAREWGVQTPRPALQPVCGSVRSDVCGQRVQSRFRRFVKPAQTCADHTRTSDPLARVVPIFPKCESSPTTRLRARAISNPQPACLPPPSFDRRYIAFVRPEPRPPAQCTGRSRDCRLPLAEAVKSLRHEGEPTTAGPSGANQSLRERQQRHGLASGRLVAFMA